MTALLVQELMNAATSFHKLHLHVNGPGSYAQHKALTREYTIPAEAWGIVVDGANRYTLERRDGSVQAEAEYVNRLLLDDPSITLEPAVGVYFNGLGEPIDASGTPLATSTTFTINGTTPVIICTQTGFAMEGAAC